MVLYAVCVYKLVGEELLKYIAHNRYHNIITVNTI